jgi:hypothetical protein
VRVHPFWVEAKLLFSGHVHSLGAQALLGFVLLCGFAVEAAVGVVRQIFAVSLYRRSVSEPPAFVDGGAQRLAV